jgi:hypothetical protein
METMFMDMETGCYEFDLIIGVAVQPDDLKTMVCKMVNNKQVFPDQHAMNLILSYTADFQKGNLTFRCIIPKEKPIFKIETEIRNFFFGECGAPCFLEKGDLFLEKVLKVEYVKIDWDRIDNEEKGEII